MLILHLPGSNIIMVIECIIGSTYYSSTDGIRFEAENAILTDSQKLEIFPISDSKSYFNSCDKKLT